MGARAGEVVVVPVPPLTAETRASLLTVVNSASEASKASLRRVRVCRPLSSCGVRPAALSPQIARGRIQPRLTPPPFSCVSLPRQVRKDMMDSLKKLRDSMGEDEVKRREKEARLPCARDRRSPRLCASSTGLTARTDRPAAGATRPLPPPEQVQAMTDAAMKDVEALAAEKVKDIKGGGN